MILGIELENFDVFDKDKAGILIDDIFPIRIQAVRRMPSEVLMPSSAATAPVRHLSWDAWLS